MNVFEFRVRQELRVWSIPWLNCSTAPDASSWHRCNERKRCKAQRTERGNSLPPRLIQLVFDPKGFQKSQSQGIPSGQIIAPENTRTVFENVAEEGKSPYFRDI